MPMMNDVMVVVILMSVFHQRGYVILVESTEKSIHLKSVSNVGRRTHERKAQIKKRTDC